MGGLNIIDAIKALAKMEETIEISSPVALKIKRSYVLLPPGKNAPEVPCTMHTYRLVGHTISNSQRQRVYVVRSQLLVGETGPEDEGRQEIGVAFHEAFLQAFAGQLQVDSPGVHLRLVPAEGIYYPARLEWLNAAYIGLEHFVECRLFDAIEPGP